MHASSLRLTLAAFGLVSMFALSACKQDKPAEPKPSVPAAESSAAPATTATPAPVSTATSLRPVAEFASIADEHERSLALFDEAAKVITHPRCLNCHPKGDTPTQGMDLHIHNPPVQRAGAGMGAPGMMCPTCHQAENFAASGVPGNPAWHLAPKEMAWQGKSLGEICAQLKDPGRNGNRDLAAIHEHMAMDGLVGWAWNPGGTRTPAPGTQEEFGALIGAWIESGAACPSA